MWDYINTRSRKYHKVIDTEYVINKYGLYFCNTGRMRDRIIMPLCMNGEKITYNDRTIHDIKNKSKHAPDQDFEKLVYGLDQAVGKEEVIIVEGAFDLFQVECFLKSTKSLWKRYGVIALMNANLTTDKCNIVMRNFKKATFLVLRKELFFIA